MGPTAQIIVVYAAHALKAVVIKDAVMDSEIALVEEHFAAAVVEEIPKLHLLVGII